MPSVISLRQFLVLTMITSLLYLTKATSSHFQTFSEVPQEFLFATGGSRVVYLLAKGKDLLGSLFKS